MRVGILVLVLLLVTAALLFGPGLLGGSGGDNVGDAEGRGPEAIPPPGEGPVLAPHTGSGPSDPSLPVSEPEPERFPLIRQLKVLFLLHHVSAWVRFQADALKHDPNMHVTCFVSDPVSGVPPVGENPPLTEPPTMAWFDEQGFDVLVVSDLDPFLFEPSFWEGVAARVRAGTLGLWVQPGIPIPPRGSRVTPITHPLLEQPALRALLPVAEALAVQGPKVPGAFVHEAPFALTAAGEAHPASRIVAWPEWSRAVWQQGTSGPSAWGTKFCYPVHSVRPGSTVLVEVHPPQGTAIPMYVQGPLTSGRVLWFGAIDFGHPAYYVAAGVWKWAALLRNALIWLAGRAP